MQIISQAKQKRIEYESREKAIRDYNLAIYKAEQRGIGNTAKGLIALGVEIDTIDVATNKNRPVLPALNGSK